MPQCFIPEMGHPFSGIRILGFKDRDTLRFQDQIKHAYFIYPDESVGLESGYISKMFLTGIEIGILRKHSYIQCVAQGNYKPEQGGSGPVLA